MDLYTNLSDLIQSSWKRFSPSFAEHSPSKVLAHKSTLQLPYAQILLTDIPFAAYCSKRSNIHAYIFRFHKNLILSCIFYINSSQRP